MPRRTHDERKVRRVWLPGAVHLAVPGPARSPRSLRVAGRASQETPRPIARRGSSW